MKRQLLLYKNLKYKGTWVRHVVLQVFEMVKLYFDISTRLFQKNVMIMPCFMCLPDVAEVPGRLVPARAGGTTLPRGFGLTVQNRRHVLMLVQQKTGI